MNYQIVSDLKQINWVEACAVIERAPLGTRLPEQLKQAFFNSYAGCMIYHEGALIGMGRGISDGVRCSGIFDVVVLPEYQGKGVGKLIMQYLLSELPKGAVTLYAVPGKEVFYEKLGFRKLLTAMGILQGNYGIPGHGYVK
ncbi:MAG: GNAT family N-acetyltransferase [SAR324 cluster bacterium]|uniref:GNAT family N-acetyltransferase n=1 Tax=SAR324 cluster bacterium TaxID=2024889 RepID=A0A2A4T2Q8_9DELT|nr:MAG: GNAT family N-acetyltransferase [SAR324 cluster bacterium]